MRPEILNCLFADAETLPGVGAARAKLLAKAVARTGADDRARLIDLIWHLPFAVVDRSNRPSIAGARTGDIVTLRVTVGDHQPARQQGRPYKVRCYDDTGFIDLVFFNARGEYLERQLPVETVRYVSGQVDEFNHRKQIVHPDYIAEEGQADAIPAFEPLYRLTAGLTRAVMRRTVHAALERLPQLPEWIDHDLMAQRGWPHFDAALKSAHNPGDARDLEPVAPAQQRLAYDELLAGQLALALVRAQMKRGGAPALKAQGKFAGAIRDSLPYSLTGAQQRALGEIRADLERPERMLRLLQGDVGAGKTVVALLAMAHAAEAGGQSALMAPTEVLARQHFRTIEPLCEKAGLTCALLTGREKGKTREAILSGLASGEIKIVVGTHALFQADVDFADLVFAVVDEQHRFGVHQRLALTGKGERGVHLLVMTATPIPRTLVLSHFGDMDVSRLDEKPAGRKPIDTRAVPADRVGDIVEGLRRALAQGARAYWICPLVEESEQVDLTPVETRHKDLLAALGPRVGLVHGRMAGRDKDAAMADFAAGRTQVLVATTVVEVGVDVPEASIIVIEHAERFGLAQLHQLRGRVGRGDAASSCILLYKAPLGETAKARLAIMRETEDGFRIAEEDLKLRGEGEILGTRQSGSPGFRIARLEVHGDLLQIALQDARLALERDPKLLGERGEALRLLLYLFEKDAAVRLTAAG